MHPKPLVPLLSARALAGALCACGGGLVASAALILACSSKSTPEPGLLSTAGGGGSVSSGGGGTGTGTGTTGTGGPDGSIAGGLVADASVASFAVLPAAVVGMFAQPADLLFAACADGSLHSVDSTGATATIGSPIARASQVAADSSAVYVLVASTQGGNDGAILRIDRSSGLTSTLISGLLSPSAIVTDTTFLYWLDGGTGTGIRVAAVPLGGGVSTTLATYPSFGTPGNLSITGGAAYFTASNGNEAELLTANVASGTINNIASLLGQASGAPTGLAVDDVDAFVMTGGNAGALLELSRADAGLPVTTLVAAQAEATGLRFLGTELVWLDATAGSLQAYDTLSGLSGTLATNFPNATATAVGDALYVAYNNGVISTVSF